MIWKTENMPNELEALEKEVSRQNIYGVIYLFLAGKGIQDKVGL